MNDHLEGLIGPDSDESLTGPHAVDSAFEEVGTSRTPVNKPTEQSLRPSALLEEIRRGKMTVGEKTLRALHPKKVPVLKHLYKKLAQHMLPLSFLNYH